VKDPEMYLTWGGLSLPCPVDPRRKAILTPKFRLYVNHEIYFFSSERAMGRFRKNPLKYCGPLTDPVSRVRFTPTSRSPRWSFMDRPFFFSSDSTLAVFKSMPDSFAVRRGM
jgi:YHS domain-containing protein